METKLTVSFPVGSLTEQFQKAEIYEVLYKEITQYLKEDEVEGIQLYPAGWPRKVQITVRNKEIKEKLVIEGLHLFGQQIDIKDESNDLVKVTVSDVPVEWPDKFVKSTLEDFGQVVRVEREMIYVDGRKTSWTTGIRFVFMAHIENQIPTKLTATCFRKQLTLSVWYRGQMFSPGATCMQCGSDQHETG